MVVEAGETGDADDKDLLERPRHPLPELVRRFDDRIKPHHGLRRGGGGGGRGARGGARGGQSAIGKG